MHRNIYNRDGKRAARIILFFPNFSKFFVFYNYRAGFARQSTS